MPTDLQISLQGLSNLPKDRYVNTLHFEGDDWGVSSLDELWAAWLGWINLHVGGLAQGGHRISAYHPGLNPEGPYVSKEYSLPNALTSYGPAEVALCLSYASVEDPEASTPRRRGRIFLGPFKPASVTDPRPGPTVIDAALDLGEAIAQVGFASTRTWSLLSRTDGTYHKIESIWVDDAWDTQRRRGLDPTAKTIRDVQ